MKNKYLLISILCLTFAKSTQCMSAKPTKSPYEMLFEGAKNFDIELIKSALKRGANVNAKDYFGDTALILISKSPTVDVININDRDFTPEEIVNLIKLLLDTNADPNIKGGMSITALMHAVHLGNLEIVKALLQAGADLSLKNDYDETALDIANEQANKNWDIYPYNVTLPEVTKMLMKRNFGLIKNLLETEPERRKKLIKDNLLEEKIPKELADIITGYY